MTGIIPKNYKGMIQVHFLSEEKEFNQTLFYDAFENENTELRPDIDEFGDTYRNLGERELYIPVISI